MSSLTLTSLSLYRKQEWTNKWNTRRRKKKQIHVKMNKSERQKQNHLLWWIILLCVVYRDRVPISSSCIMHIVYRLLVTFILYIFSIYVIYYFRSAVVLLLVLLVVKAFHFAVLKFDSLVNNQFNFNAFMNRPNTSTTINNNNNKNDNRIITDFFVCCYTFYLNKQC